MRQQRNDPAEQAVLLRVPELLDAQEGKRDRGKASVSTRHRWPHCSRAGSLWIRSKRCLSSRARQTPNIASRNVQASETLDSQLREKQRSAAGRSRRQAAHLASKASASANKTVRANHAIPTSCHSSTTCCRVTNVRGPQARAEELPASKPLIWRSPPVRDDARAALRKDDQQRVRETRRRQVRRIVSTSSLSGALLLTKASAPASVMALLTLSSS